MDTTASRKRQRHPITLCLAQASPEVASVSWLAVNSLCLTCSLLLAVGNLLVNLQTDNERNQQQQQQQEQEEDGEEIFESQAVQVTIEYLVWSLVTTVVWIVEVALRTVFTSETLEGLNENDDTYKIQYDNDDSDIKIDVASDDLTEKTMKQQKLQTRVLFVELILALFFLVESIFDCLHWKARVEKGDFMQQELDIWINIMAYVYMTYETYKTAIVNTHHQDRQMAMVEKSGSVFWATKSKPPLSLKDGLIQTSNFSTEVPSQLSNDDKLV